MFFQVMNMQLQRFVVKIQHNLERTQYMDMFTIEDCVMQREVTCWIPNSSVAQFKALSGI